MPRSATEIRRTVAEPAVSNVPNTFDRAENDWRATSGRISATDSNATDRKDASGSPSDLESQLAPPTIYRPYRRPPTPVLIAIDEGSQLDGEVFRLRGESWVIGRTEGDVRIANDPDISGKHLELSVTERGGERVWTLRDLGSTNGTFVRVHQAALVADKELLLGYGRYRVDIESVNASGTNGAPSAASQDIRSTRVYAPTSPPIGVAESLCLVNVADAGQKLRFSATGDILGRDPSLGELTVEDPALNAQHARIGKIKNRWRIEDLNTINGCWLRVTQLRIAQDMEFQIGEQRFRFLPNGYRSIVPASRSDKDRTFHSSGTKP